MFIRYAAFRFQQLGIKKQKDKESADIKAIDNVSCDKNQSIEESEEAKKNSKEENVAKMSKQEVKVEPVSKTLNKSKDDNSSKNSKKNEKKQKQKSEDEKVLNDVIDADKEQTMSADPSVGADEEKTSGLGVSSENNEAEVDADEGKKIVESIIDSISNGDKQESK
jgi:hypothetical protein